MFRSLYKKTLALAGHRHAVFYLAIISCFESFIFPIPPDALMIPMILFRREMAFFYATVCSIFSVLGGIVGYIIGYFLFKTIGEYIISFYHLSQVFHRFIQFYNTWDVWIVVIGAFTPFPYKVVTIASGAASMPFMLFIISSILARSARFYLEAGLIWYFGKTTERYFYKHSHALFILLSLLLILGIFLLKLFC